VSDAVCCHRTSHILLMGVDVAAVAFGGGCCWPQRTRITSHPLCVLCLVSFHFRFTFFPFALLLPTFIVELYSCRFHFIFYFIVSFFLSNLHFSPLVVALFLAGVVLTYMELTTALCMRLTLIPFPGGGTGSGPLSSGHPLGNIRESVLQINK